MAEITEVERDIDIEEIKKSKMFLESLISNAPDIIYLLDDDGNIRFINNTIKNYGWNPEDLIGKSILEIVHPEDKQKALYKVNERRTGERATKVLEIRLLTKEKEVVPLETKIINYVPDAKFQIDAEGIYKEGKVLEKNFFGTHGVARDISIRKKMDNVLQKAYKNLEMEMEKRTSELVESNSKLLKETSQKRQAEKLLLLKEDRCKILFNTITDPMFVIDLESYKILEANKAACKILKYSSKEIETKTIADITQSEDFFPISLIDKYKPGKIPANNGASFQVIFKAKDKTDIPLEMHAYVFSENRRSKVLTFVHRIKNNTSGDNVFPERSKRLAKIVAQQAKRIKYLENQCVDKKIKI